MQATDEAPVRTFPRQRVVEAVEPLSKVECGTRASPIQAVVAFYELLIPGSIYTAVQSTRVDPSGVIRAWLLLSVLFMTGD